MEMEWESGKVGKWDLTCSLSHLLTFSLFLAALEK
jgi:hypothetical protein